MTEVWRAVVGYEGLYEVSSLGRVRSLARYVEVHGKQGSYIKSYPAKVMKQSGQKYAHVILCMYGDKVCHTVHSLVLIAFVGPRPEGEEVMHRNHDRKDNRLDNLEWGTHSANQLHSARDGRHAGQQRKGEKHPLCLYSDDMIASIRDAYDGSRGCYSRLAREYGVSHQYVRQVVLKERRA